MRHELTLEAKLFFHQEGEIQGFEQGGRLEIGGARELEPIIFDAVKKIPTVEGYHMMAMGFIQASACAICSLKSDHNISPEDMDAILNQAVQYLKTCVTRKGEFRVITEEFRSESEN